MGGPGSGPGKGIVYEGSTILDFNGQTLTVAQWSRQTGLSLDVILKRLTRGWDVERTLTTPARRYGRKGA